MEKLIQKKWMDLTWHSFQLMLSSCQVPCSSWFDDEKDTELLDLIPYFESLNAVDDVVVSIRNNRNRRFNKGNSSDEDG